MRARDSQTGDAAVAAPRIWGKYRFSSRLDAGDQSLIYRGVEVATGRQVAIEILAKPALDDKFDERLGRAVEVFARARGEQLIAVYEHGVTQDGTRFVAMAPLVGQSLAARLKARRRLPVAEAIAIACGVAEAIAGLHQRQMAYGALEPSRVFLVPDAGGSFRVRLLFGVSRPRTGTTATLSGGISDQRSGTYLAGGEALYGFLSPEQLTRQPSRASDVFAVGALTYAMIAGTPPFARGQSPSDVAPLEPLSSRVEGVAVAPPIDAALARALAFDPESRHDSLQALAQELRDALADEVAPSVRPAESVRPVEVEEASLPDPESLVGTTIAGRFRIERWLRGGSDELNFRAIDQRSKAAVNVAVFVATRDAEHELGERLASADRLRQGLVSGFLVGGFVDVLDRGDLRGGLFYVVSDAWDETLADRLRVERPMPAASVVALIVEVAAALDTMHARGEVHRELAPANIVFADADRSKPKLLVVSAPRRKLGDETSRDEVPASLARAARSVRSIFGACAYASPEEASSGWIGVRSNVYSLAVIAYEMLTGTALFDESSPFVQLLRHVASPVEPPSRRAPAACIPEQWDEAFVRALSKQASARFVSAGDFAEELAYALESAPPPAIEVLRSDPLATEASVVVPLVRTRSQTSAVEPSVVVPLTRLAGGRGSSSAPPRTPEDSDWDWDSEPDPDSQSDEAALPLTRQAAIPLVTPRPAPLFAVAESAPSRDSIKMTLLALAVVALAAGVWFAARYLR
jgi:serine/threonine protein kinase